MQPSDDEARSQGRITDLLSRWRSGEADSLEQLLPLVYGELRTIAERLFQRESSSHTLQPTAVLHEAYLKLFSGRPAEFHDRTHFYAVASRAMRQVLVDHARARFTTKRGGGRTELRVDDSFAAAAEGPAPLDILALDEALTRLSRVDAERARLVELRYFGGLSVEETAALLGVSTATVKRDWRLARAFLARELTASP
jgi:RNA polymerase sigma factor (TIGR02999 family)